MGTGLALPTPQFAVWARSARLRLPYPLDITTVPGIGVPHPDPELPELRTLTVILRSPRVSAFGLRSRVDGTADSYLAVAANDEAMLLTLDTTTTTLAAVPETELALGVVTALPSAPEFALKPAEVPEPEWDALVALARSDEPNQLAERCAEAGLPRELGEAMAAAATEPVVIGVLGASAWASGSARVGPRLAAWYEYPSGAVLTERVPPHGRTGPVIRVSPLTRGSALRALAAAVGDSVTSVNSGAKTA
jgi:hypothetical protein